MKCGRNCRASANKYSPARHVAQGHAPFAGTCGFLLSRTTNPQVPAQTAGPRATKAFARTSARFRAATVTEWLSRFFTHLQQRTHFGRTPGHTFYNEILVIFLLSAVFALA